MQQHYHASILIQEERGEEGDIRKRVWDPNFYAEQDWASHTGEKSRLQNILSLVCLQPWVGDLDPSQDEAYIKVGTAVQLFSWARAQ